MFRKHGYESEEIVCEAPSQSRRMAELPTMTMSELADVSEPRGMLDYARRRYLFDDEFRARVERGVQVVQQTEDLDDDDDLGLVTRAVAVGLAMRWVDLTTGLMETRRHRSAISFSWSTNGYDLPPWIEVTLPDGRKARYHR